MKDFLKFLAEWRKRLTPPRVFSWQTLILMSVLCWGMALGYKIVFQETAYESANAGDLLAGLAWVFLILAIDWWASEKPWYIGGFHLGAWLTGALVCLFVFAVFSGNYRSGFPSFIFLMWPVISALIALLHKLHKSASDLSVAQVFILILASLLISCWWEFGFLLQDWLQEYPSLLADNFERSAFVIKVDFSPREKARGVQILNSLEDFLKSHVEEKPWLEVRAWLLEIDRQLKPWPAKGQPWPEVHQWLVQLDEQGDAYDDKIMVNLGNLEEDKWWYIKTEIDLDGWPYELKLQAIWRGPTSNAEAYEMTKVCQIGQTYQPEAPRASALPEQERAETGFVECSQVKSSLDRRTESSD
ncbi:DUF5357 family protein [Kamptonema formosum]|uniref:DUF5357 family protein n=1 Tax=Kamptonema formosum TaxID=331992 RepID=UPI000345086C|nr:DUF5357 family protein [Oscillatoria sp. PCC 10802]